MAVRGNEEWNTANNVEAERGLTSMTDAGAATTDDATFLSLLKSAAKHSKEHHESDLHPAWSDSYRAYRNEHYEGSKYTSPRWRGRSRLFRPKTRTTVRKRIADAAASLFATNDALNVEPANRANPRQRASAALMKEILNYRLHRRSAAEAIPWFVIAMAAYQDSQIASVCISKQYWEYERIQTGTQLVPMLNELGLPTIDPATMLPAMDEEPVYQVRKNRPVIRVFPPELVLRDPAANWIDQAQDSGYLILKHPMQMGDAVTMLAGEPPPGATITWRMTSEADLKAAVGGRSTTSESTVRQARTDGEDPYQRRGGEGDEFSIVWLWECFIRYEGETYHYWSVEDRLLVSDPVLVEEAYPEHGGRRPVVIGFGAIDSHRTDPMSPVESWQPLQMEMNDLVNLRLDAMKQSISPVTKVVRGRKISAREVQDRSADAIIYVQNKDDVTWDAIPGPNSSAYEEMERLNSDFDDQAGIFSQGSVMSSRTLNETVGGMNLMASSANVLGQFDIQVWVETWAEPVLRQLVALERYYETDEMVLMMAGEDAEIEATFGIPVDFDLLDEPVTVSINAGLGVSDPMQRLQKLAMAADIVARFIPTMGSRMKQDEIISEAFGLAGYHDGMRFFHPGDDRDPRIVELQGAVEQMQAALDDKQADREAKLAEKQVTVDGAKETTQMKTQAQLKEQRMQSQSAVVLKRMDVAGKLVAEQIKPPPKPPMANGKGPPRPGAR